MKDLLQTVFVIFFASSFCAVVIHAGVRLGLSEVEASASVIAGVILLGHALRFMVPDKENSNGKERD